MVALMRDGKLTAAGRAELRKTAAGRRKMKQMSRKKTGKHYPVQRRITMGVALPSAADTSLLIRTDKLMSNVNHRLYRQSRVYQCKIDIDANLGDGSFVEVYALADTWYNMKAYQLAKKMFDENSMEERSQLGAAAARWNDFRVDHGDSIQQELEAIQFTGSVGTRFTAGEYLMSEVADAAGNTSTFRWVGSGANTFNIIDEYDTTGNTNNDPAFPVGANVAYDGLTDEVDDNQMEHIAGDGNAPPYSNQTLENQAWVLVGTLFNVPSTGASKLSTGYFNAPCGLIRLKTGGGLNASNVTESIHLEVKSGDYKGVHAPSYLE